MTAFQHYLQNKSDMIETRLNQLIPEKSVPYSSLFEAARYSLNSQGKRLRPILVLATTEMLGGDLEDALTSACAIEMVHTYSIIHDDLPSMDNDDFRRGKPSLHRVYPEGHAILAGDFLLTFAFETLANDTKLTPEKRVLLISSLAKNSGGEGMIAGQVMDLQSQQVNLERLREIHLKKTAALITASIEFGAIIADASSEIKNILWQFAQHIGLAFQIIDDVLDVTSNEKNREKAIPSDIKNDKTTYPSLLGLEKAQDTVHSLLHSAKEKLDRLPYDTTALRQIANLIPRQIPESIKTIKT